MDHEWPLFSVICRIVLNRSCTKQNKFTAAESNKIGPPLSRKAPIPNRHEHRHPHQQSLARVLFISSQNYLQYCTETLAPPSRGGRPLQKRPQRNSPPPPPPRWPTPRSRRHRWWRLRLAAVGSRLAESKPGSSRQCYPPTLMPPPKRAQTGTGSGPMLRPLRPTQVGASVPLCLSFSPPVLDSRFCPSAARHSPLLYRR
jgi:hypothetical protein